MANEVVKYHNKLNTISMRKWTAEEMNFFFSVIAKVRNKGTKLISFDANELKELSGFADNHEKRWVTTMDNVADKALNLQYAEERGGKKIRMNLFTYFEVDSLERTVEVEVSSKFEYVVNQLEAQFTQYELAEFTEIRSTYAKTMYRLIKQWRTIGKKEFQISEFRELLEIPKSYTNGEISRRVLEPIERELSNYFLGFKYKIIKSNKRGNPVTGYLFTWKPETTQGKYVKGKYQNDFNNRDNIPVWSNPNYKNTTSKKEVELLKKRKEEILDRMGNN